MDDNYDSVVSRLLAQVQPRSVLCLGAPCPPPVTAWVAAAPGRLVQHLAEPVAGLGRHDLILVADLLEHLDPAAGTHLLARLRDLYGGRFLLTLSSASGWQGNELLALGLVQVGRYASPTGEIQLYRYDLGDYKTTPDWLNARFWAHPERWDQDFW